MPTEIIVSSYASPINSQDGKPASSNIVASLCFRHEDRINTELLKAILDGTGAKLHLIYNYGRDKYTYGLPSGYAVEVKEIDEVELTNIIEAEVGHSVVIEYVELSSPESNLFSEAYATEHWGYIDGPARTLTNSPFGSSLDTLGLDSELNGNNSITHSIIHRKEETPDIEEVFYITTSKEETYNPSYKDRFYQVKYRNSSIDAGNIEYWFYNIATRTISTLDGDITELTSPFLPVVPLREKNKNLGIKLDIGKEDEFGIVDVEYARDKDGRKIYPDTELYKTSKKLLKLSGLDMDVVTKNVHSNPDIDDIDNVYIIYGINVNTKTKHGKFYLYQFFSNLAEIMPKSGYIDISDASYAIGIEYSSCTEKTVFGELAVETKLTHNGNTLIIQRKVDDETYKEVKITSLKHINYVYKGKTVKTDLEDALEDDDNYNFIIPLQYELAKKDRSLFGRQDLINESLQMVCNSYKVIKTSIWDTILSIILVVITIVLAVYGAAQFGFALIAAVQQGIGAVLILAAQTIALSVGITYVGKLLSEVLPPEWALAITVVLSVYTVASGMFYPNQSTSMMQLVSGFNMAVSKVPGYQQEAIAEEYKNLEAEFEELNDELQELQDELDSNTFMDFYEITSREMISIVGETPEEFYDRTIHTGNIGVALYEIIPNYVSNALTLPDIKKLT